MVAPIDFSTYLRSLVDTYSPQHNRYTLTDLQVEIRIENPALPGKPDAQKNMQKTVKVERAPVLAGLRKYALSKEGLRKDGLPKNGQNKHVLLVGKPGSGKSMALRQLLWEMAQTALEDKTQPIPVLVALRGLRNNYGILEAIAFELQKGDPDLDIEATDIQRLLLKGPLFLLLDGVNEIPSNDVQTDVQQFRENYTQVPMIFTSRELGTELGIEQKLEMCGLTEPQMRSFVQKYLPDHADQLLQQLKDRLRELAETPLLLKLLCEVYDQPDPRLFQKVGDLRSKGELFRAVDRKYNTWKKGEGARTSEKFWQWNQELLGGLAFGMLQADGSPTGKWFQIDRPQAEQMLERFLAGRVTAPGEKAKDWLQDLLDHHLLQAAADPNQIEFRHQLFQEYYAAEYLLLQLPHLSDTQLQRDYLNLLKWTEPLAMMAALIPDQTQALRLVKLALAVDWNLGALLAGEGQPDFQETVFTSVIEEIKRQQVSPGYEIQILGDTRSKYAVPILLEKLTDEENQNLIFKVAFALEELGDRSAVEGLLPLLDHDNPLIVVAALFVLGKLGNEQIIPDLQRTLRQHPDASVRQGAMEALGELGIPTVLPDLHHALKDPDDRVREKAVEALGKLGDESAIPELIKIAVEDRHAISAQAISLRWTSAKVLGQINHEKATEELFKVIKTEENYEIRRNAVEALGKVRSETAIEGLIAELKSYQFDWEIANALVEIGNKKAVPGLIRILNLKDSVLCEELAAFVLGELGDTTAVPHLINALNHDGYYLQSQKEVVEALGKLGDRTATPRLYQLYETVQNDSRNELTRKVVIALGRLGDVRIQQELLKILGDQAFSSVLHDDWWYVFQALENIGGHPVVLALIQVLLKSPNRQNRWKAAETLGNLGDDAAIDSLLSALADENSTVRWKAAEALGRFDSPKVMPKLSTLLKQQKDPNIREATVQALGYLEDESAVTELLEILNNLETALEPEVYYDAVQSLVKLSFSKDLKVKTNLSKALGHPWKSKLLNDGFIYQVQSIKGNCKFYNYEIFQLPSVPAQSSPDHLLDKIEQTTQAINERTKRMADQPSQPTYQSKYQITGNPTIVEGNMEVKGDNVGTKNIYNNFGVDEDLQKQITDLYQFIAELETKHPAIQTEAEAEEILDAEIVAVQTANPSRWQALRRQMTILKRQILNPERHFQATKATIVEVVKSAYEKSLIVKAIVTYIDKLSEEPNHGA